MFHMAVIVKLLAFIAQSRLLKQPTALKEKQ